YKAKYFIVELPTGSRVVSAESYGKSSWARTAKILVVSAAGSLDRYFLKVPTRSGKSAQAFVEGEYRSANDIRIAAKGLAPKPVGWGEYQDGSETVYFLVSEFCDMDFIQEPDPAQLALQLARIHQTTSQNGKFGYDTPTVIGVMERSVTWENSWAKVFSYQLKDAIHYDNKANGKWSELDAACGQLIKVVIPRLLGILQSGGRTITPALIHGDLWEENIGINKRNGNIVFFDPGCIAYNESLYLCEKYAPFPDMDKYMPSRDPTVTGERIAVTLQSTYSGHVSDWQSPSM
ncbi:Fructosamine/Ketosamine-3-kinase, partial [Apiospora arundinis]